jgi:hypothetical protein
MGEVVLDDQGAAVANYFTSITIAPWLNVGGRPRRRGRSSAVDD